MNTKMMTIERVEYYLSNNITCEGTFALLICWCFMNYVKIGLNYEGGVQGKDIYIFSL